MSAIHGLSRLRVVVLGMMGRAPFGGQTWLYLNWLRGLQRLGHDVWYVEDDTVWPYDPIRNTVTDDYRYAICHIRACMERIGLSEHWAYRLADRTDATAGLSETAIDALYPSCDLLLNIVGATALRDAHRAAPYRVYVETDPVTVELGLARGGAWSPFEDHHVIATYGENYGAPDCGVPLGGRTYLKTRQPIDLDLWPAATEHGRPYFTTIGNYRQGGKDVEYQGDVYHWSKHYEWERIINLPRRVTQPFRLALQIDEGDRQRLELAGWNVVPALDMSLDVFGRYPEFIRSSRGGFTVAKDQNVRLRSGWFSERDACYLASGRPVVTQDTGFGANLPTGTGLFGFRTLDDAVEAIETINSDYRAHCVGARAIAEAHFDAVSIVSRLLADLPSNIDHADPHAGGHG